MIAPKLFQLRLIEHWGFWGERDIEIKRYKDGKTQQKTFNLVACL